MFNIVSRKIKDTCGIELEDWVNTFEYPPEPGLYDMVSRNYTGLLDKYVEKHGIRDMRPYMLAVRDTEMFTLLLRIQGGCEPDIIYRVIEIAFGTKNKRLLDSTFSYISMFHMREFMAFGQQMIISLAIQYGDISVLKRFWSVVDKNTLIRCATPLTAFFTPEIKMHFEESNILISNDDQIKEIFSEAVLKHNDGDIRNAIEFTDDAIRLHMARYLICSDDEYLVKYLEIINSQDLFDKILDDIGMMNRHRALKWFKCLYVRGRRLTDMYEVRLREQTREEPIDIQYQLLNAIAKSSIAMIANTIDAGADVNNTISDPLGVACSMVEINEGIPKYVKVVEFLLKMGAKPTDAHISAISSTNNDELLGKMMSISI